MGIVLFTLALVWTPRTADPYIGPRMVILALLAIIRWLRQSATRAARLAVGGLLAVAVWAVISSVRSGAPRSCPFSAGGAGTWAC